MVCGEEILSIKRNVVLERDGCADIINSVLNFYLFIAISFLIKCHNFVLRGKLFP